MKRYIIAHYPHNFNNLAYNCLNYAFNGEECHGTYSYPVDNFGTVVGENPTPNGILALWAVYGLSIVYWVRSLQVPLWLEGHWNVHPILSLLRIICVTRAIHYLSYCIPNMGEKQLEHIQKEPSGDKPAGTLLNRRALKCGYIMCTVRSVLTLGLMSHAFYIAKVLNGDCRNCSCVACRSCREVQILKVLS